MPSPAEYGRTSQSSSRESRRESSQESWEESRSEFWLSIVRIFICEVVLLLVLAGAFVGYLNWSSEAAFAQFLSLSTPSAQLIKSSTPCDRGV